MEILKFCFAGTLTAVLITTVVFLIYEKRKKRFTKVGRVSKIILYPVKSLSGFEVQRAECKETGLQMNKIRDRMWMLVKTDGHFLIPLDEPRLVSLHTKIEGDQLIIQSKNMEKLRITIISTVTAESKIIQCKMYDKLIEGVDCGEKSAEWFQKFLKRNDIRLVQYLPNFKTRPSDFENLIDLNEDNYPLIYQAANPYLILSQPSLDDLNDKLQQNVSHKNFRANIIIDDCDIFEEDKWKYLKIGKEAVLIRTVPCERCSITKINPDDGSFMKEEPLKTLKTYRISDDPKLKKAFGERPIFGMNYGLVCEGDICIGDEIYGFN